MQKSQKSNTAKRLKFSIFTPSVAEMPLSRVLTMVSDWWSLLSLAWQLRHTNKVTQIFKVHWWLNE
jgi:hypothetical protein